MLTPGNACCSTYWSANDLLFVDDLLNYLEANLWSVSQSLFCLLLVVDWLCLLIGDRCSVDTSKVFATGMSNGGYMVMH